ncbi:MAG: hypothetical protein ACTSWR_04665 [Candidatus Helarchaeota archaeon]
MKILSTFFFFSIIFIMVSYNIFAHTSTMHQHITNEAFKLLKLSFPNNDWSEMEQYIGTIGRVTGEGTWHENWFSWALLL